MPISGKPGSYLKVPLTLGASVKGPTSFSLYIATYLPPAFSTNALMTVLRSEGLSTIPFAIIKASFPPPISPWSLATDHVNTATIT